MKKGLFCALLLIFLTGFSPKDELGITPTNIYSEFWGYDYMNLTGDLKKLYGSKEVKIAILDSGINTDNKLLVERVSASYNAFDSTQGIRDKSGHGTNIAELIIDNTPPNIKIMPIKVLNGNGRGSLTSIIEGLTYAINHKPDVINISINNRDDLLPLKNLIQKANKKGIIVVNSSGNKGDNELLYPSKYKEVISVGSIDINGEITNFSNYGGGLDFVAPGTKVPYKYHAIIKNKNGTSQSAALLTKVISIALSHHQYSPEKALKLLVKASMDINKEGYDIKSGFGTIDARRLSIISRFDDNEKWQTYKYKYKVDLDKKWNIKFNMKMDIESIKESVLLLDSKLEEVKYDLQVSNNKNKITLIPSDKYNPRSKYYIICDYNLKSKHKTFIQKPVKFTFNTK